MTQSLWLESTLSQALLAALPYAVIAVEGTGQIRYINDKAEELCRELKCFKIDNGRLAFYDPYVQAKLMLRIREVCEAPPIHSPNLECLTDELGRPKLEIILAPLYPDSRFCEGWQEPLAQLILRTLLKNPGLDRLTPPPYGLTKAELRLATALVEGMTPAEYAEAHHVRENTVRTQVRGILSKTGTRRITEAVALFSSVAIP
ncbi:hypothetical protein O5O45_26685 [Hahella aquimaris]|uniref:helix-turn-helix transcriptional regulator n=1 Tax=Hahella sp. HNIBRBA332 TaxID=3015983 RepID=UPI00273BF66C|nr:hypothetical protein [Hahella sp. HNIBRBA332]WLQ13314.1 hypothetical protein O5O45_26685 [Hahella sp. HNIBRBA332]